LKIVTIVGARPQFIKASVISHKLRKKCKEILVHTGQHFDFNMSEKFFEELHIPVPDYNLGINGGTHGQMTGRMLMAIEGVLIKEEPDMLLVYGDTNSTLAGALAAAKLHIPVCHVEAGVRTYSMTNPEEINRICTDHVSSLLLASTENALNNLKREGIGEKAVFTGDPMYDAFLAYKTARKVDDIRLCSLEKSGSIEIPEKFYYMTCHREENTEDEKIAEILSAMESLDFMTIYPVHPRNKERAKKIVKDKGFRKILLTEPVGYLESLALLNGCEAVVTDSGGLQREAFFAEKKCVTILDFVTWQETMVDNRNQLSHPEAMEIVQKLRSKMTVDATYHPFGDGHAADKICRIILSYNEA